MGCPGCLPKSPAAVALEDVASPRVSSRLAPFRDNVCSDNQGPGILVREKSRVLLPGDACMNNEGPGILFTDKSGRVALENRCQGNMGGSIKVEKRAQPTLKDNLCEKGPTIAPE